MKINNNNNNNNKPSELSKDIKLNNKDLSLIYDNMPNIICIIPLFERPFFPPQSLPMLLDSDYLKSSIEKINQSSLQVGGFILAKEKEPPVSSNDLFKYGTSFKLHSESKAGNKVQIVAEGLMRFKVKKWLTNEAPFIAEVEYIKDNVNKYDPIQIRAYILAIINSIKKLIPLNAVYNEELKFFLNKFINAEPSYFAEFAASLTTANRTDLQKVLEANDLIKKLNLVLNLIKQEIQVVKLQTTLADEIEEKIDEQQREYFLREQLKIIQEELGIDKQETITDKEHYEKKLEELDIPEDCFETIENELDKMAVLEPGSPEYAVTRNYLDTITGLPWGVYSKDKVNIRNARKVLNNEHEGLEDIKERILEFIAVGSLKGEISGSIILLVGPPGVGKTSIGKSIATSLNREFYRFSVGGMKDEAEIKGHRRTYIGAMPGKIIRALVDVGTSNPVIMLDEIDKMCASYQGDPGAALLEVLDSEQNNDFLDHYLDVRYDLSKILFICTANTLDTIPQPLLDRMEVLHLAGYIAEEKLAIAKKHLWPRLLKKSGLKSSQLKITTPTLKRIIDDYARGAGVRDLERKLAKITRRAALKIIQDKKQKINVTISDLPVIFGEAYFPAEMLMYGIGVMTGLAWTAMGGATITIEVSKVHNNRRGLRITGNLGEVMRESAEIAFSYVSAKLDNYGGDTKFFDHAFVHIHVPEGATPKDGPSAGITIATALLSLANEKEIKRNIAMTGEITLTGHVLAVGGIREKIIAARRNRIKEVILPECCRSDIEELPKYLLDDLKIHFVEHFDDIYHLLFCK